MTDERKFNPVENFRKKNKDPVRTTKNIHLNIRQYRMVERLTKHWKCNFSEAVRRLLAPTTGKVDEALKEKKKDLVFKYELPMERSFWTLLNRHDFGCRP